MRLNPETFHFTLCGIPQGSFDHRIKPCRGDGQRYFQENLFSIGILYPISQLLFKARTIYVCFGKTGYILIIAIQLLWK